MSSEKKETKIVGAKYGRFDEKTCSTVPSEMTFCYARFAGDEVQEKYVKHFKIIALQALFSRVTDMWVRVYAIAEVCGLSKYLDVWMPRSIAFVFELVFAYCSVYYSAKSNNFLSVGPSFYRNILKK